MRNHSKISVWLLATLLIIGTLGTFPMIAARHGDENTNINIKQAGEEMVEGAQRVRKGITDKILHPFGGDNRENGVPASMKQSEQMAKDTIDQARQFGNEALDRASTKTKEQRDMLMDKVGTSGNPASNSRDEEPETVKIKEASKHASESAQGKLEGMRDEASEQAQEAKRSILDRITHPFGGTAEHAAKQAKHKASEQMDQTSNKIKADSGSIADLARDAIEQAKAKGSEYTRNLQDIGSQASGKGQEYSDALNQATLNARDKVTQGKDTVADKVTQGKDTVADKVTQGKDMVADKVTQGKDTVADKVTQGKDTVADKLYSAKHSGEQYMGSAKDTSDTVQREVKEGMESMSRKWGIDERTIDELALKHGEEELKQMREASAEGRLHIVPDVQSMEKAMDGSFKLQGGDKYVDYAALEHAESVMREIRDALAQGKLKVVPHSEWCSSLPLSSSSKSCKKESLLHRMNPFKSSSIESKLDATALKSGEEELRHVREMGTSGKLKASVEEVEKSGGLLHRMNPFKSDDKAVDSSALKAAEHEMHKLKDSIASGSPMRDVSQSVQDENHNRKSMANRIKSRLSDGGQKLKVDL